MLMRPDCAISWSGLLDSPACEMPRVVHEDVETAELFLDALRRGGDGGPIRDVQREGASICPTLFATVSPCSRIVLIAIDGWPLWLKLS